MILVHTNHTHSNDTGPYAVGHAKVLNFSEAEMEWGDVVRTPYRHTATSENAKVEFMLQADHTVMWVPLLFLSLACPRGDTH